ncbi:hypothetical protein ACK3TF_004579 [Chlorella vulgaris]
MVVRSVYPKFLSNDSGPFSIVASLDTTDIANLIANATSMDLISANIGKANIDSAYLVSANLTVANIANAFLQRANVQIANLTSATIANANIASANLTSANLTVATIVNAIIASANLASANLTSATIVNASIASANLTSANLNSATIANGFLEKANVQIANLTTATIANANIASANLTVANIANAFLQRANVQIANLTTATIVNASIASANLASANLTSATIANANIASANLTSATIVNASIASANLASANLTSATIANANIASANLTSATIASAYLASANANVLTSNLLQTPVGVQVTSANPGALIEKRYNLTSDRYGIGQYVGSTLRMYAANIASATVGLSQLSVTGTALHDWLVCNSTSTVVSGTLWSNNVICPTTYSSYFGFGSVDRVFAYASSPNQWVQGTSVGDLVLRNMGSNNRFVVGSSESEGPALSVKTNRVGVKTLDPMSDLHVTGNVRVDSGTLVVTDTSSTANAGIVYTSPAYQGPLVERRTNGSAAERYGIGIYAAWGSRVYSSGSYGPARVSLGFALTDTTFLDGLVVARAGYVPSSTSSYVGINTTSPTTALHVVGNVLVDGSTTLASGMLITDSTSATANGIQWTSGSYQGALVEKRGSTVDRYGVGVYSGIDYVTRMYASGSQSTAKVSVCFPTAESTFLDALVVTRAGANAASTTSNVGINTASPTAALDVVGNVRVSGAMDSDWLAANATVFRAGADTKLIADFESVSIYQSENSDVNVTGIITLTMGLPNAYNTVQYQVPALAATTVQNPIPWSVQAEYQYSGTANGFCIQMFPSSLNSMGTNAPRPSGPAFGVRFTHDILNNTLYLISGSETVASKTGRLPVQNRWYMFRASYQTPFVLSWSVIDTVERTTYWSGTVQSINMATVMANATNKSIVRLVGVTGGQASTQQIRNFAVTAGNGTVLHGDANSLTLGSLERQVLRASKVGAAYSMQLGPDPFPLFSANAESVYLTTGILANSSNVFHANSTTVTIGDSLTKVLFGNVGINTATPQANLHVVGNVLVDGSTTLASRMLITDSTSATGNGIQWTSGSYQGALVEKRGSTVDRYGVGVYSGIDYITRIYASGSQSTAKVSVCFPTAESTFLDALVVTRAGANAASTTSNVGINTVSPAAALHVVGNARVDGSFVASGDVTAFSDRRLKTNLHPVLHSLDKIEQIAGYTYNRVDMPGTYAGLVAQELQQVLPEAVVTGDDGILSVSATSVLALLVQGMKELRSEVAVLKGSQQFV